MMKASYYTFLLSSVVLCSCSSLRTMDTSIEDDIYYIPNEKPLMVKEVETITGQSIDMNSPVVGKSTPDNSPENGNATAVNRPQEAPPQDNTPEATPENASTGYWIGGFKGNNSDRQEAARIINRYPEGFGFISNGQDIALNLSFSPDWNVYTENGRYWWFPSSSNIRLYNTFLFGTYPKYIWTVVWNDPFYDSWAFDSQFNFGWGGPGWHFGLGWNYGFHRPWYGNWYGGYPYWNPWYDPWWGNAWYPSWHHDHWYHPQWGGNTPDWTPPVSSAPNRRPGNPRPNLGGGSIGLRPETNRPANNARPNYSNLRPGRNIRPENGTTQPADNQTTQSRPARPANSNSRPTTTRPGNTGTANQYTRPAASPNTSTNKSGNVKYYNRKNDNYRPTFNNNRSYNQNTNPNRDSYFAPKSLFPSGNGGNYTTPNRSTTRSGGARK